MPLLARASLRDNILFGLPYDANMFQRALECTHCYEFVVNVLPKGLDTLMAEEDSGRSTLYNRQKNSTDIVVLTKRQLVLMALARAVYKDAAVYLLDGVMEALGTELASRVMQDCLCRQLCVKTIVLSESHALAAAQGSVLEACNMVYLVGARRADMGVVAGLVGSGELANIQQLSDRWHQRHDLETNVCGVVDEEPAIEWLHTQVGAEEKMGVVQSPAWSLFWYCGKSRELCMVAFGATLVILGHALRCMQDWWLQELYAGKAPADMLVRALTKKEAAYVLVASVVCSTFLFAAANAVWAAIVGVSVARNVHKSLTKALVNSSLSLPVGASEALLDVMGKSCSDALLCFPQHMQSALHSAVASLACLSMITVQVVTVRDADGKTPDLVFVFIVVPILLLGAASWVWWSAGEGIRSLSYVMATARAPIRSFCASTAISMLNLRLFPHDLVALETMQRLLDRHAAACLSVTAVQLRAVVIGGLVWSVGGTLMAASLLLLRDANLLHGSEELAQAALVMALVVQVVMLAQWALISGAEASVSFHAFVGRASSLLPVLASAEEPSFRAHMQQNKLDDKASGWCLQGISVEAKPGVPAPLRGLDVRVEAGQRVMALGRRGSGIETLPLLLLKGVIPQQGRVLIGGVDLSTLSSSVVRDYVKFVPRRPIMFAGSVLDNLWQPCNDEEDNPANVLPAADMVTVLKFVGLMPRHQDALPDALAKTQIEHLSDSDRMLLAVARVLLLRPVMLVLGLCMCACLHQSTLGMFLQIQKCALCADTRCAFVRNAEDLPLSLDPKALTNLDQMLVAQKHLTVLHTSTVAARLHCFQRLIVMHEGAIVQDGSPKALIAQPGVVADMLQATGPVATNRMREHLGASTRALSSALGGAFDADLTHSPKDLLALASTVGVLGPISEDADDSPDKQAGGTNVLHQRECVHAPLDAAIARGLEKKELGYLFMLIQSCISRLHVDLMLDVKTGLPLDIQVSSDCHLLSVQRVDPFLCCAI